MNPPPHSTLITVTSGVSDRSSLDMASAALAKPPPRSSERDRRLLTAAREAGVGGQAMSVLAHIDIGALDAHDRVIYLQVVTAHTAWLEAVHTIAVAAVSGPSGGWVKAEIEDTVSRDVDDLSAPGSSQLEREHIASQARDEAWEVRERAIALEVSMAMRVSPRTAGRRISAARLLLEHLRPAVDESLAGRWGYGHLRVVEKELGDIPEPLRAEVFDDVLPYAAIDHPRRLTERIRKSLARRDAAGAAERMRERARARDVALWNLPDGQARLVVTGPYEAVTRIHRVLTDLALARRQVVKAACDAGDAADETRGAGASDTGAQVGSDESTSPSPSALESATGASDNAVMAIGGYGPGEAADSHAGEAVDGSGDSVRPVSHARPIAPVAGLPGPRLGALRFDVLDEAVCRLEDDMDGIGRRLPSRRVTGSHGESIHSPDASPSGNPADTDAAEPTDIHNQGAFPSGNPADTDAGRDAYVDPWTGPRVHAPGSRPAPQAAVVIDLATALGMADEPGYLPGYGWIPAPIAREILADTDKWRRWLVDDSSRKIIEAGATRYRPSQALRDLIAGRDLTCTADTCTRPASNTQLDHAIDFDGSNTTPDNMHAVCGPDHLVVTAGHFLIDSDEQGQISWVSTATGHAYPSHPDLLHEQPVRSVAETGGEPMG